MKSKQKLKEMRKKRKELIKECIKILKSKESKGSKIKKYYAFVEDSPLLTNELSAHLREIRHISLNEFSTHKEILFLQELLKS